MKKSVFVLAALALAACTAENVPQQSSAPVSFTAFVENEPESKAVLALNGESKPQTFWEDGDAISIYSSNDTDLSSAAGHKFVTTLGANATEAEFALDGESTPLPSGDYLATYPYRSAARGVNFTVSPYRVAAVDVPNAQTLVAGTYDKKACPMVAFCEESSSTFSFKNAAALLKFRVSESNIVAGRIEVDAADKISGRFRADVDVTTHIPNLVTYVNQTYYNYIDFTIDESTPLATGTDYYIAIRPTTLTSDLKIYLNGNLVKTISTGKLAEIERNKIYNLGTLTTPADPAEKKLVFDFTGTPQTGWPTAGGSHHGLSCTYTLYGVGYSFILTDCGTATKCQTYWAINAPGKRLALAAAQRYCGLPVISGYKLVQVVVNSKQLSSSDTTSVPKMGITHSVTAENVNAPDSYFVTGGEVQSWAATGGGPYTYNLSGTNDVTQYYIYAKAKGAIANLTLTYELVTP